MQVCDGKQEFNSEFLENIISPDGQSAPVQHHGILQCREKKPGAVPTMMKCRNRRERFDLYTLIQGCVLCYVCVCVCVCVVQLLKAPEESLSLRLFTSTRAVYLTPDDLDA